MPAEVPIAHRLHHLPGRLRLRLDEKRGDETWFDRVAVALATTRGVRRVVAAPRTASLLIEYDGDLQAWLGEALARGWFHLDAGQPGDASQQPADRLREAMELPSAAHWAAFVLFLMAGLQAARRDILPPAVSLLVYAATAWLAAERRQATSGVSAATSSQGRPAAPRPT